MGVSPASPTTRAVPALEYPAFLAERAVGAPLSGAEVVDGACYRSIVTHHDKVEAGSLFIASEHDGYDGVRFVSIAVARGALGIVHRQGREVDDDRRVARYAVDDTLDAYRRLAGAWRHWLTMPIVAIGGSCGKTTTTELTAGILRAQWPDSLHTERNENGFAGLAKTLLRIRREYPVAVIEIGIDAPGSMAQHLELVRPTVGLLTSIGLEHLEGLGSLETIIREEGLVLSWVARHGGTAVVNLDDPAIRDFAANLDGTRVGFCLTDEGKLPPVRASDSTLVGTYSPKAGTLAISGIGLEHLVVQCPLPGAHNRRNLLGAIAVARRLGVDAERIAAGLLGFAAAPWRTQVHPWRGATVLCDCYNANPQSMQAALDALWELPGVGNRLVCLGDMLELGPDEERLHRNLAPVLAERDVHAAVLLGPRMRWLAEELSRRGFAGDVLRCETIDAAVACLVDRVRPGDRVLIKGSRGMGLEAVWAALSATQKG